MSLFFLHNAKWIISAFSRQYLRTEVSVRMGVYCFVEVFPILTAHYQPLATHPLAQNCHRDSLSQVNSSGRHGYPKLSNPPPLKTHTHTSIPPPENPLTSPCLLRGLWDHIAYQSGASPLATRSQGALTTPRLFSMMLMTFPSDNWFILVIFLFVSFETRRCHICDACRAHRSNPQHPRFILHY